MEQEPRLAVVIIVFVFQVFDCGDTAACFHAPTTALTGIIGAKGTRAVSPQEKTICRVKVPSTQQDRINATRPLAVLCL